MEIAFDELKHRLTNPPVLAFPDFEQPFLVEMDVSSKVVREVLSQQKEDGKIHPIHYASRTLNKAERNYSACEREEISVIFGLNKFRVYLLSIEKKSPYPPTIKLCSMHSRKGRTWMVSKMVRINVRIPI